MLRKSNGVGRGAVHRRVRAGCVGWLGGMVIALTWGGAATAATAEATASTFTGDALNVDLTIDDASDPGNLVITLEIASSDPTGDLRGFFAQVADESLLAGLSVSGSAITQATFDADAVINLGGGNNLNGGGTPCPCDLGVEIGTPGIGSDDYQSVTFTLSHSTETLTTALFDGQDFGVRVMSVGSPNGGRGGSSKLSGVVPEPSTALLLGLGLAALGARRKVGAAA